MPAGPVFSNGLVHVWEKRTVPGHRLRHFRPVRRTPGCRRGAEKSGRAAKPPRELSINLLRELEEGPIGRPMVLEAKAH